MTKSMASCVLPTWIALLGLLTYHVVSVHGTGGPFCYSCDRISRAQDCDKIIQCYANEKCFSRRFIGSNLHEFYTLGCIDQNICKQKSFSLFGLSGFSGPLGRKRKASEDTHALSRRRAEDEMLLCLQCCDGEYCNQNLCGSSPTSNMRRCFECSSIVSPKDCDKVVECGGNHQCHAAAHVYQNTGCMVCCNDRDYCNFNACDNNTVPTTTTRTRMMPGYTPPVIVLVPGPAAHAQYGHNVYAKCSTDPGTTVTWVYNNSALPHGVRTDNKGGLRIDHLNDKTAGVYKCVAVAPSGSIASKQITITIIQVRAVALYIDRQPNGSLRSGQSVSLTCIVAGYPIPTISWAYTRNGVAAIPTSVAFSRDKSVLTINPYSAVHNDGNYSCHATNSFGVSVTKIHIP